MAEVGAVDKSEEAAGESDSGDGVEVSFKQIS